MKQSTTRAAKNYARALIELTADNINLQEQFLSEISKINNILSSLKDAKRVLENPGISKEEKKKLAETLRPGISGTIINLLCLLIDNHRSNLLLEIQNYLTDFINKKKGIVIAEVYSTKELDSGTLNMIVETLRQSVSTDDVKEIKIDQRMDPLLIGGIKVKINDLVYDGSIKGKLENLKRRLG